MGKNNDKIEKFGELLYSHKLELKRIILEKVLLGSIIAATGLLANILMENYRDNLSEQRFFMQKHLEEVYQVKNAYVKMNTIYMNWIDNNGKIVPENYEKETNKIFSEFTKTINGSSLTLSEDFLVNIQLYLWIYEGIYPEQLKNDSYREFLVELNNSFQYICKSEIGMKHSNKGECYFPVKYSFHNANVLGSRKIMQNNYNTWKKMKKI